MRHATRQLAFLVLATTIATLLTVVALLAPQIHPVAQFGEALGEPAMELLSPLASTWLDDLAGGLAVWSQVTAAVWIIAEGSYWLTRGRYSTPVRS